MINRKCKKYILVILISVGIISGLSPFLPAFGGTSSSSIEVLADITLGPLTADNYDIQDDTLVGVLESKNKGAITVDYENSAELKVSLDSAQVPSWLNPSDLKIKLGEEKSLTGKEWKVLGDNVVSLSLKGGEKVYYDLKYNVENQSTVPSPGTYYIGLDFSLTQTGSCNDPIIEISMNYLGPDENPKVKLTSSCGPIVGAQVNVIPGGTKSTGNDGETPNFGNLGSLINLKLGVTLDGNHHENLDGYLQFQFDGINVGGDFQVLVSGAIGPGESVTLTVRELDPGKGGKYSRIEGANISGYATGTTDSNGEFTFTLPEGRDFSKVITVGVDSFAQDATLNFDYNFTP